MGSFFCFFSPAMEHIFCTYIIFSGIPYPIRAIPSFHHGCRAAVITTREQKGTFHLLAVVAAISRDNYFPTKTRAAPCAVLSYIADTLQKHARKEDINICRIHLHRIRDNTADSNI
jgi:hypothetical protein